MSVRMATAGDIPRILEIYAPYVINTTYSFEYEPPTLEAFTQRFHHITQQFPWLVWEEDGLILGYAYASAPFTRDAYSWCAEPSIYLIPKAHGRGIGRQLYEALEDILRRQGYQTSYAIITEENFGSVAFHEAMGYQLLATFPRCGFKHGRWLGTIWMEKRLGFVDFPSKKPTKAGSIVNIDRNY